MKTLKEYTVITLTAIIAGVILGATLLFFFGCEPDFQTSEYNPITCQYLVIDDHLRFVCGDIETICYVEGKTVNCVEK